MTDAETPAEIALQKALSQLPPPQQVSYCKREMKRAQREMGKRASDAFQIGYVNPEWRAMSRRLFHANRADYECAKEQLEAMS